MVTWHTQSFRELAAPVADVLGARTAKDLEKLRIHTVGDLLRFIPRRYLSGTDLTDLATLSEGEHVAVIARVADIRRHEGHGQPGRSARPGRLEVLLSDGHGRLTATFFGKTHLLTWWERQLREGVAGVFVGKVGSFRGNLQMSHPVFAMMDGSGRIVATSVHGDQDVFSIAYAFTPDEAAAMARAGADVIGAHVGLTVGGMIGAQNALALDEACERVAEMTAAARAERPGIWVVAHGGPFDEPENVQAVYDRVDVDGFLGASSIERLPVERAIEQTVRSFRDLRLRER